MRGEARLEWVFAAAAVLFALAGYGVPRFGASPVDELPAFDEHDQDALRIVSWNLGGAVSARGAAAYVGYERERVAATLRAIDADVVFLAELGEASELERLSAAVEAGRYRAIGPLEGSGRQVGFLVRRGDAWRVSSPVESARALAIVYDRHRRRDLTLLGLHASPWSAEERNALVGAGAEWLVRQRGGTILLGDFNLDLDLDKRRDLFSNDEHLDVETYNYVARRYADAGVEAGPTAEPDRRLDYVFCERGAFELEGAWVLHPARVGDMDHAPLVVDVRLD